MKYTRKAIQTKYNGTLFRSRLEARWAAFFDIVSWQWKYEPCDLPRWSPDFYVKFSCSHSDCSGYHDLLVEVKPYSCIEQFSDHECMKHFWGGHPEFRCCSSAAFGFHPDVTYWEMSHGAGGGSECVQNWIRDDADYAWKLAGNEVMWNFNEFGKRIC